MKLRDKILITACACAIAFSAIYATTTNIKDNAAGYQLGTSPSQAVGVLGATPSSQLAAGTGAYSALQTFGFIASGGNDYTGQHVTVQLSAAQINGMYATPVQLVAAAGSGKTIIVTKAAVRLTRTSTAFAGGGAAIVQYGNTVNGGGTQSLDSTLAAAYFTGSSGVSESVRNGAFLSDQGTALQNTGVYISNATAAFTTGTGTATVDVWYHTF
jgi:hypothetical protein